MRMLARTSAILMLLVLGLGLAAVGIPAAAQETGRWSTAPAKPAPAGEAALRVLVTQGDTVEDPFVIPSLPFTVTGNTCAFNHDYDHACPYQGSLAKDVVYRYECSEDVTVTIDLCQSTYDTKVYVFEDVAGNVIDCNDDYCSFQSRLWQVPFAGGHTYYIVIDGYDAAACGDYVLVVEEYIACVFECPAGALPEGEPECHDDYNDNYNGGCGCLPYPCFTQLQPSCDPIVICGTSGVFTANTATYRETDWYQIDLTQSANICLSGDAEIPMYYFIIDGRDGCMGDVVAYAVAGPCELMTDLCYQCGPGTWWLWAGPLQWDLDFACGSVYWMEITGYTNEASPAEGTTWGRVKDLFR